MSRVAHPAGPRYADVLPADHPPAPPADLNDLSAAVWPRGARLLGDEAALGALGRGSGHERARQQVGQRAVAAELR